MDANAILSTGDWVVHSHYGVGQIINVEVKPIQDIATKCYKVKTEDSTYWFPASGTANPRVRPIATQEIIRKVIDNLRSKASHLDTDRVYWKEKIEQVQADNDLLSISLIIRDLSAQQVIRSLNQFERNALSSFKERLLMEWASIMHEGVERLRTRLLAYLKEGKAKLDLPQSK